MEFLENVMYHLYDDFSLEILTERDMGENHGRSYPNHHKIQLREDVYERACDGYGRDRFTVMHEISHQLLHEGVPVSLARSDADLPAFRDSEWQANALAGEILMPHRQICLMKPFEIVERYKVSEAAARTQLRKVRR